MVSLTYLWHSISQFHLPALFFFWIHNKRYHKYLGTASEQTVRWAVSGNLVGASCRAKLHLSLKLSVVVTS